MEKTIVFDQPLRGVEFVSLEPPALSAAQVEARCQEAYQRGVAEAKSQAAAQVEQAQQQLAQVRDTLRGTVESEVSVLLQGVEEQLPRLVMTIVQELLGGLTLQREHIAEVVKEVLGNYAAEGESLTLYLHPDDLALLQPADLDSLGQRLEISWKEDASLQRGGCMVYSRFGTIDATLDNRLQKVREQLEG